MTSPSRQRRDANKRRSRSKGKSRGQKEQKTVAHVLAEEKRVGKPFRQKRLGKKQKKVAQKAAKHLPTYMQDVAFSYAANQAHRGRLGTFGPASPVRRIDPKTGEVIDT